VRQVPSPSDAADAAKNAYNAAKDQAKQKAKDMADKIPKSSSGRR